MEIQSLATALQFSKSLPAYPNINAANRKRTLESSRLVNNAEILSKSLKLSGFMKVAKFLQRSRRFRAHVNGSTLIDEWNTYPVQCKAIYFENGTEQSFQIQCSGEGVGSVTRTSNATHRYQHYQEHSSFALVSNEAEVFCQCHEHDVGDGQNGLFLECSVGLGGCNGWVHAECVGLGHLSERELMKHESIVCSLCSVYLGGCGEEYRIASSRKIDDSTLDKKKEPVLVGSHRVWECGEAHDVWGFVDGLDSNLAFSSKSASLPSVSDSIKLTCLTVNKRWAVPELYFPDDGSRFSLKLFEESNYGTIAHPNFQLKHILFDRLQAHCE